MLCTLIMKCLEAMPLSRFFSALSYEWLRVNKGSLVKVYGRTEVNTDGGYKRLMHELVSEPAELGVPQSCVPGV